MLAMMLITLVVLSLLLVQPAQDGWVFPHQRWTVKEPADVGVDASKLAVFARRIRGSGCIIRNGYLVHAWGDFCGRHNWASASKPTLSTMLFTAIHEGKLGGVESLVGDWGWDLKPKDRTMTFRHLADMTSGYACAEEPGRAYGYNDFAIKLYVKTLDRVFGTADNLVTAGHERFTVPLGFEDADLFDPGKGRVVSSPRDFARLGWWWMNRGRWHDRQMLPASFFDKYVHADVPSDLPTTVTPSKSGDDYLGIGSYGGGVNMGGGQGIYGFNWWHNANLGIPGLLTWPSAPPQTYLALGRAGKEGMVMMPSLGIVAAAYNDLDNTWGDAVLDDPPNSTLNLNLKLLAESVR